MTWAAGNVIAFLFQAPVNAVSLTLAVTDASCRLFCELLDT